jgi:hypothetical protein
LRFREHRRKNLKQFNQNILEYLKENSKVKVEDVKDAFLQSFRNFVSPLMQSSVGPDLRNELKAHGFVKKPMRIGIVGSRSAP